MNKFALEDIVRVICENIPKNRRFSTLQATDFLDLWSHLTAQVENNLSRHKSVTFPGFGHFHVRNINRLCSAAFYPSLAWNKVPGYHAKPPAIIDDDVTPEPFNFSATAFNAGMSRENVELAVKDIVHAVLRILRRRGEISLSFGNLGKLRFQRGKITFSFTKDFICSLEQHKIPTIDRGDRHKPIAHASPSPDAPSDVEHRADHRPLEVQSDSRIVLAARQPPAAPTPPPPIPVKNSPPEQKHNCEQEPPTPPKEREQPPPLSMPNPESILVQGNGGKGSLFRVTVETVGTHMHGHTGDRLWSDRSCPICRNRAMPEIDFKQDRIREEKMYDQSLLRMSQEADQEASELTKAISRDTAEKLRLTAQYNCNVASGQEILRRNNKLPLPVGNMFEKRDPGPDRADQVRQLGNGLKEQIALRQSIRASEKEAQDAENRVCRNRIMNDLKISAVEAQVAKLQRRHQQQEFLGEQIKAKQERAPEPADTVLTNPFARSENLMLLYQQEKARQLYQEQLAIIRQRREYEARVANIERKHSLERLAITRHELERDIRNMKNANFEQRKSLESYWKEQLRYKNTTQALGT